MSHPPDTPDPKRVVEQGYDRVAREYGRLEDAAGWPRMRWLKQLLDRLQPGVAVLDLGCGSGEPADVEIAKAHRVTGVDISETQIACFSAASNRKRRDVWSPRRDLSCSKARSKRR